MRDLPKGPQAHKLLRVPQGTHRGQARALIHREVAVFILFVRRDRVQLLGRLLMPEWGWNRWVLCAPSRGQ
jgi:hypothetical protein